MKKNQMATDNLKPCSLILHFHFLVTVAVGFLAANGFGFAAVLHSSEANVLKVIAYKLGKTDWDFGKDPCSGSGNWNITATAKGSAESHIACDCSFFNNTTCRITNFTLKGQNLSAAVPQEFSRLSKLRFLDLSHNLLMGSIPAEWATMRLEELSVMGNLLSGPFPNVLTRITTLRNLSLEGNLFSGPIPTDIEKMVNLKKIHLSSNAFTGEVSVALAKLTNLTDLRLSDNKFSGKIPSFISNWTKIKKLHIQGCSLEGPIPPSISALTTLTDLRISDLKGSGFPFPLLKNMESIKTLLLRNCLIHGEIPNYIGDMKNLKYLDLSFNNLTGTIPASFEKLSKIDFMYLTGNNLTGHIPQSVLRSNRNMDVSCNNFTWAEGDPVECPQGNVNLVESYHNPSIDVSFGNNVDPCLKKGFPCSDSNRYRLHINCGGSETTINGNVTYENDSEQRGASMLYLGQYWAFSSTGKFMDDDLDGDTYIETNRSSLSNISAPERQLYVTARVSPISLTYYGLCLKDGNYTVKLHFAEIIFMSDGPFRSLGKRIFDVYIQEKLVLKDFNIEEAAGGAGRTIVKNFTAVVTRDHTLKIRLYWAGKGSTGIPKRGVYGPLISAISVDPNFEIPSSNAKKKQVLKVAASVSSVSFFTLFVLLLVLILRQKGYLGGKISEDSELRGLDLQTGLFKLRQIKAATRNFDAANKIGEGGFGCVYKGLLSDGTVIAVKQLSSKSKQGNREFVNEIGMISGLQHPNLVKLYGCCAEGNQLSLIYEYLENNCLSRALFGRNGRGKLTLDWPIRQKICLGIARGLTYLHEESRIKMVHRDIKTSNVLLDKDLNAKISDFGLAKLTEDDNTHITTRVAGTIGYMAPEYAMRGHLTNKADVYSFGVVALEIVSGKSNTNYRPKEEFVYLLDWAYVLQERGSLMELIDPDLGSEYSLEQATVILNVALLCTNASPTMRPTMSQVVSMLEGRTAIQELLADPGFSIGGSKFKAIRNHFWQSPSEIHSLSNSIYGPDTASSTSNPELEESDLSLDTREGIHSSL